jgi:hypothetical protein
MKLEPQEQVKYDEWLATFRELDPADSGLLLDTVRTMAMVLGTELAPDEAGVIPVNRESLESLVLLRSMIDGFIEVEREQLGAVVAAIQRSIVSEGDAKALMALQRLAIKRRAEAETENAKTQAQAAGVGSDVVSPAGSPEALIAAIEFRRRNAETLPDQ